jgi:hypothetical protein
MYQGHGYSEGFCAHMEEVIKKIRTTDEAITPLSSPDDVCSHCPHLQPDGRCDHEDRTSAKDKMLLESFGLTDRQIYLRADLKNQVLAHMNQQIFDKSCSKCSWHQQGLCSFELWQQNFKECM